MLGVHCAGLEILSHNKPCVGILDLVMGSGAGGRHNIEREAKLWGISRLCGKLIGNVMSGLVMKVEHPPPFARTNGHFARPWCGVDLMSCEKHGEQCKADNT